MENTPHDTSVSPSDNPDGISSEQTLDTPHFDEQSIQNARPAVPLVQNKARRFWPLALVLMCGSSLLGGILGITVSRYENRSEQISTPAARVAPEETSQNEADKPRSQPAANLEERANDAGPGASQANGEETRAARLSENRALGDEATSDAEDGDARAALHGALNEWLAATNARDIQRQLDFYPQTVNAFYLKRNVPREAVRAEKSRVFGSADLIDIRAGSPSIRLSPDGRSATMRYRKKYAIEGGGEDRRGEVVQELRWRRTDDGWKIVSERDMRVIN
jgi:ketosteroid isomerase-like protein